MNIKEKTSLAIVLGIFFSSPVMAIQEVLNGSYVCEGFVDTFQGAGIISIHADLGATSGITSSLRPSGRVLSGQSTNLVVLTETCNLHIEQVLGQVPQICAVGPVSEGSPFPESTRISFDFSCKSGRNNIMDAISVISRIPITAILP